MLRSPKDAFIIGFGLTSEESALLQYASGGWTVFIPRGGAEMCHLLAARSRSLAVVDTAIVSDVAMSELAAAVVASGGRMLHVSALSPRAVRHLLLATSRGLDIGVVLRGVDRLEDGIRAAVLTDRPIDATSVILRALPPNFCSAGRALVTEATALGRKSLPVSWWATMRGDSTRSLERRLAAASLPTAKRLLTWTLLLHTTWRVELLGWELKRAAVAAGVSAPRDLTRRFRRIEFACTDSQLPRLSFPEAVNAFVRALPR